MPYSQDTHIHTRVRIHTRARTRMHTNQNLKPTAIIPRTTVSHYISHFDINHKIHPITSGVSLGVVGRSFIATSILDRITGRKDWLLTSLITYIWRKKADSLVSTWRLFPGGKDGRSSSILTTLSSNILHVLPLVHNLSYCNPGAFCSKLTSGISHKLTNCW